MKTKEAIERVRSRFNKWVLDDEDLEALQTLGLVDVESKDERIRKWLIEMVEELRKANPTNAEHNGNCSEAIAYLEKQKERKQYDIDVLERHITKDSVSELAHTVIVRNGWEIVEANEQKPSDYDHEMWKNCEVNFEGGKKEVINNPEKYGLCKPSEWSNEEKGILLECISILQNSSHWVLADKLSSLLPQPKQEFSNVENTNKPSEWNEKIRKELWEYFHQLQLESDKDFSPDFTIDDIIEWLENRNYYVQVKTIVRSPKFRIGDIIQRVPCEKSDRTARVCFIDENGYGVDYSHLGDTIKRDYIGFSFEDNYELVKEDKTARK